MSYLIIYLLNLIISKLLKSNETTHAKIARYSRELLSKISHRGALNRFANLTHTLELLSVIKYKWIRGGADLLRWTIFKTIKPV